MQLNVLNDLAKAKRRWTEKKSFRFLVFPPHQHLWMIQWYHLSVSYWRCKVASRSLCPGFCLGCLCVVAVLLFCFFPVLFHRLCDGQLGCVLVLCQFNFCSRLLRRWITSLLWLNNSPIWTCYLAWRTSWRKLKGVGRKKKTQNILAQGKRGSRGLETNIILLLKSQYEIESSPSVNKGFIRFQNMLV